MKNTKIHEILNYEYAYGYRTSVADAESETGKLGRYWHARMKTKKIALGFLLSLN